ncbi:MAG: SigB/SigF/SigG family RNA polymerase sigma factor [Lachnospiraceae bacterium]
MQWEEQIKRAQQGEEEALRQLVSDNTGLVYSATKRFFNRGCETEDLLQIGMIGLIKAIKRFDVSYGVAFSTYAVPMIIGEIKRFLRDDGMLKVSRTIKENGYKISRCREKLCQELGREPRLSEISEYLHLSCEDVVLAMEADCEVESIYRPAFQDVEEENYMIDQLNVGKDEKEEIFTSIYLDWGLEQLEEKERQLIEMRYFKDMTQSQVAEKLNMTQVGVSRMEKRILKFLRQRLE